MGGLATDPQAPLLDGLGAGLTEADADELVETIRELHGRRIEIVWIDRIGHVGSRSSRRRYLRAGVVIQDLLFEGERQLDGRRRRDEKGESR